MNENIKDIRIGQGLGELRFGATRDQVKALLGAPADVERYTLSEFDEDETEAWHYDDLFLSLSFDQEHDWRLSSIAISSEKYTLDGTTLIGRSKNEIMEEFRTRNWGNPTEDEEVAREDPGNSLVHVDEASMSLWFEGDELTELQIGPFYDDEEVRWPK